MFHVQINDRVLGGDDERVATAAALESAKGVLRSAVGKDLGTRITPSLEFILDGLPESARALDSLLERVHALDAEVAKARENAKPVVEDPYKVPRVIAEE